MGSYCCLDSLCPFTPKPSAVLCEVTSLQPPSRGLPEATESYDSSPIVTDERQSEGMRQGREWLPSLTCVALVAPCRCISRRSEALVFFVIVIKTVSTIYCVPVPCSRKKIVLSHKVECDSSVPGLGMCEVV